MKEKVKKFINTLEEYGDMKFQKVKLQMVKETTAIYTAETIKTPLDIVTLINKYEQYDLSPTEKMVLIGLNTKNQVNIYMEVATGGVDNVNCNINDLFKPLLLANCTKFILAHNHPSGDATPSSNDKRITNQIKTASAILGLQFLDHIVIGDDCYSSIMSEMEVNK